MSIPKIIHMCWFGRNAMSKRIEACVKSIRGLEAHGYDVRIWDESNYDVGKAPSMARAYERKKWSLVSNYARLDVLRTYGGIYLDTDIEIVRPFDALLQHDFFLGFMWDCALGTAVLGATPGHKIITDILAQYDRDPTALKSPNNDTFTDYFLAYVPNFRLDGYAQLLNGVSVSDKYVFEHPSLFRRSNYTVHHFEQSWKPRSGAKIYAKQLIIRFGSLWLYRKYVCWKSLRISPYYGVFRRVREQERVSSAHLAPTPMAATNGAAALGSDVGRPR